jgi:heavy metal translocating P-type ATPase
MNAPECDLCGLPLTQGRFRLPAPNDTLAFCCPGCSMVYAMLLEAADATDPAHFRDSDLFRRCMAAGVIPASETEQVGLSSAASPLPGTMVKTTPPDEPQNTPQSLDLTLNVAGMWCPACAWVIAEALGRLPGVRHAACRFATDSVKITYDPVETGPDTLTAAISRLGYAASPPGEGAQSHDRRRAFIRFFICAFLSMNVMMLSFALYSGFFLDLSAAGVASIAGPIALMASVVFFYGGWPIHRKAWAGLRARAAGMEALITMGSGSAYGYSLYQWLQGSIHLYFDSASMLITLVLLGKLIEQHAKTRVQESLTSLFDLAPSKVRLCSTAAPQGRFVSAEQLQPGDRFRVVADEQIVADGLVAEGHAEVDEAALTGEARPRSKGPGDTLRGGARLISGELMVTATTTCEGSLLGQMLAVVHSSLDRQTVPEGRTDRLLRIFVPLIMALATATLGIGLLLELPLSNALMRAITVLVISCPCALGIAIPLARVAGLALASRQGILVRDFSAFETATTIDTVVFDKTGTLTSGRWHLESVAVYGEMDTATAIALAAGLEQEINTEAEGHHPVALEILRQTKERGLSPLPVDNRRLHPSGISGRWQGQSARIGNRAHCRLPRSTRPDQADSQVFLTLAGKLAADFSFADPLRPGSAEATLALIRAGQSLHLITGDGSGPARKIADQLGLPRWRADLSPLDKSAYINDLRQAGARVAMVGDGVNDAAALGAADLAVALYAGHPLGHEVSDITLMAGDPRQLMVFNRLAVEVNRKIRQNLGWSMVYNLVSIPIAMSGWLTPLVAVCAMLTSSLSVTLNTYGLVRRRVQ